jgi:hypothetical protein
VPSGVCGLPKALKSSTLPHDSTISLCSHSRDTRLLAPPEMRKVFACLFTLAALATAAGYAFALSEHEPLRPVAHIALVSFAVMSTVTAFYLCRSRAAWEASMVCPSCHQLAGLSPCSLGQPRRSVMALLFGGVILTVLIQHSQTRRFRCAGCSAESSRRSSVHGSQWHGASLSSLSQPQGQLRNERNA